MSRKRRPAVIRRQMVEATPELVASINAAGRMCIWHGCEAVAGGDLPPDWVNVLVWWWPQPSMRTVAEIVFSPFCRLDAVLCGKHARELEGLLKPLGRELDGPVAGSG